MKDFRSLKVWEKSHSLAKATYKETYGFPKEEIYGLVSQMRRAVISIPTNIAEGCGKNTDKDFAKYLQTSMGSACEIEYLILLSGELGFMPEEKTQNLMNNVFEIKKMLASLIKNIRDQI
jgi:four helix bundle protein